MSLFFPAGDTLDAAQAVMDNGIFDALLSGNIHHVHTILMQYPSAASSRDEKDNTVAMIAAMHGHTDVLVHIRELSIELLAGTNKYGMNTAHYAALCNQPPVLNFLWMHCPALFFERNFWGNTPAGMFVFRAPSIYFLTRKFQPRPNDTQMMKLRISSLHW